jgi:hypothetical protein
MTQILVPDGAGGFAPQQPRSFSPPPLSLDALRAFFDRVVIINLKRREDRRAFPYLLVEEFIDKPLYRYFLRDRNPTYRPGEVVNQIAARMIESDNGRLCVAANTRDELRVVVSG